MGWVKLSTSARPRKRGKTKRHSRGKIKGRKSMVQYWGVGVMAIRQCNWFVMGRDGKDQEIGEDIFRPERGGINANGVTVTVRWSMYWNCLLERGLDSYSDHSLVKHNALQFLAQNLPLPIITIVPSFPFSFGVPRRQKISSITLILCPRSLLIALIPLKPFIAAIANHYLLLFFFSSLQIKTVLLNPAITNVKGPTIYVCYRCMDVRYCQYEKKGKTRQLDFYCF